MGAPHCNYSEWFKNPAISWWVPTLEILNVDLSESRWTMMNIDENRGYPKTHLFIITPFPYQSLSILKLPFRGIHYFWTPHRRNDQHHAFWPTRTRHSSQAVNFWNVTNVTINKPKKDLNRQPTQQIIRYIVPATTPATTWAAKGGGWMSAR